MNCVQQELDSHSSRQQLLPSSFGYGKEFSYVTQFNNFCLFKRQFGSQKDPATHRYLGLQPTKSSTKHIDYSFISCLLLVLLSSYDYDAVPVPLFPMTNFCTFALVLPEVCVQCQMWLFSVVTSFSAFRVCCLGIF